VLVIILLFNTDINLNVTIISQKLMAILIVLFNMGAAVGLDKFWCMFMDLKKK